MAKENKNADASLDPNDRESVIFKCFDNCPDEIKTLVRRLVREAVFWEEQIAELRQYPMIITHPRNKTLAKPSAISRQMERATVQYTQIIKTLSTILLRSGAGEEGNRLLEELENFVKMEF